MLHQIMCVWKFEFSETHALSCFISTKQHGADSHIMSRHVLESYTFDKISETKLYQFYES